MKISISVTVETETVEWVDSEIERMYFRNRSHAVDVALARLKEELVKSKR